MSNWTRFIAGFDVHGDKQNKAACEVFFRFMKDWKPEIRVMGGDLFDFRPLRRKASEEEKRESMREDFEAGMPARTNTNWWHSYCMKGEIRFIKGRPKFKGAEHGLPQPLAIVVFRAAHVLPSNAQAERQEERRQ